MKYFFHLRSNTCLLLTRGSDDGHPGKLSKERLLSKVLRWRSVGESQARIPCSTNNPKVRVVMKLNICAPLARSSGNRMFRYKVLSIPTQAVKVHKNFVHFKFIVCAWTTNIFWANETTGNRSNRGSCSVHVGCLKSVAWCQINSWVKLTVYWPKPFGNGIKRNQSLWPSHRQDSPGYKDSQDSPIYSYWLSGMMFQERKSGENCDLYLT